MQCLNQVENQGLDLQKQLSYILLYFSRREPYDMTTYSNINDVLFWNVIFCLKNILQKIVIQSIYDLAL